MILLNRLGTSLFLQLPIPRLSPREGCVYLVAEGAVAKVTSLLPPRCCVSLTTTCWQQWRSCFLLCCGWLHLRFLFYKFSFNGFSNNLLNPYIMCYCEGYFQQSIRKINWRQLPNQLASFNNIRLFFFFFFFTTFIRSWDRSRYEIVLTEMWELDILYRITLLIG